MRKATGIQSIALISLLLSCEAPAHPLPVQPSHPILAAEPYTADRADYAFTDGEVATRLDQAFAPPSGFSRVSVPANSFGAWLRGLPLRRDRTDVLSYLGERLSSPSAAVVALDVGPRNLQQCADSAIRLHAEFLWSQGRFDALAYHFTSGDEVSYSAWRDGERLRIHGSKVARSGGAPRAHSHTSFREWLDLVFRYAGTRSLHRDSVGVAPMSVRPGDFFVAPGSPGHAVVVLDVAEAPDGRRAALLGQGFMPAQDFHVLTSNGRQVLDDVWFLLPDATDGTLHTPSWKPFHGADARRFTPS